MRRDWDMSAFGHRPGSEPVPEPAGEDLDTRPAVTVGQLYRWLGADVRVDEVAEDGSGARITIRQDRAHPWQKWTPLPFPPEAVLITDPRPLPDAERHQGQELTCEPVHDALCWQAHDDCALTYAAEQTANLLDLLRCAIDDHANSRCRGECHAVDRARHVLSGEWCGPAGADAVQAAAGEIASLP